MNRGFFRGNRSFGQSSGRASRGQTMKRVGNNGQFRPFCGLDMNAMPGSMPQRGLNHGFGYPDAMAYGRLPHPNAQLQFGNRMGLYRCAPGNNSFRSPAAMPMMGSMYPPYGPCAGPIQTDPDAANFGGFPVRGIPFVRGPSRVRNPQTFHGPRSMFPPMATNFQQDDPSEQSESAQSQQQRGFTRGRGNSMRQAGRVGRGGHSNRGEMGSARGRFGKVDVGGNSNRSPRGGRNGRGGRRPQGRGRGGNYERQAASTFQETSNLGSSQNAECKASSLDNDVCSGSNNNNLNDEASSKTTDGDISSFSQTKQSSDADTNKQKELTNKQLQDSSRRLSTSKDSGDPHNSTTENQSLTGKIEDSVDVNILHEVNTQADDLIINEPEIDLAPAILGLDEVADGRFDDPPPKKSVRRGYRDSRSKYTKFGHRSVGEDRKRHHDRSNKFRKNERISRQHSSKQHRNSSIYQSIDQNKRKRADRELIDEKGIDRRRRRSPPHQAKASQSRSRQIEESQNRHHTSTSNIRHSSVPQNCPSSRRPLFSRNTRNNDVARRIVRKHTHGAPSRRLLPPFVDNNVDGIDRARRSSLKTDDAYNNTRRDYRRKPHNEFDNNRRVGSSPRHFDRETNSVRDNLPQRPDPVKSAEYVTNRHSSMNKEYNRDRKFNSSTRYPSNRTRNSIDMADKANEGFSDRRFNHSKRDDRSHYHRKWSPKTPTQARDSNKWNTHSERSREVYRPMDKMNARRPESDRHGKVDYRSKHTDKYPSKFKNEHDQSNSRYSQSRADKIKPDEDLRSHDPYKIGIDEWPAVPETNEKSKYGLSDEAEIQNNRHNRDYENDKRHRRSSLDNKQGSAGKGHSKFSHVTDMYSINVQPAPITSANPEFIPVDPMMYMNQGRMMDLTTCMGNSGGLVTGFVSLPAPIQPSFSPKPSSPSRQEEIIPVKKSKRNAEKGEIHTSSRKREHRHDHSKSSDSKRGFQDVGGTEQMTCSLSSQVPTAGYYPCIDPSMQQFTAAFTPYGTAGQFIYQDQLGESHQVILADPQFQINTQTTSAIQSGAHAMSIGVSSAAQSYQQPYNTMNYEKDISAFHRHSGSSSLSYANQTSEKHSKTTGSDDRYPTNSRRRSERPRESQKYSSHRSHHDRVPSLSREYRHRTTPSEETRRPKRRRDDHHDNSSSYAAENDQPVQHFDYSDQTLDQSGYYDRSNSSIDAYNRSHVSDPNLNQFNDNRDEVDHGTIHDTIHSDISCQNFDRNSEMNVHDLQLSQFDNVQFSPGRLEHGQQSPLALSEQLRQINAIDENVMQDRLTAHASRNRSSRYATVMTTYGIDEKFPVTTNTDQSSFQMEEYPTSFSPPSNPVEEHIQEENARNDRRRRRGCGEHMDFEGRERKEHSKQRRH